MIKKYSHIQKNIHDLKVIKFKIFKLKHMVQNLKSTINGV
jgi:hypothetical protein